MKISHSILIGKPPDKVFYWLEDGDRAMEWMTSVTKGEIIEKTPDMVGTRFRETVEENGAGTELIGVITEFETNRRLAFHLEGKYNTVDVAYSLQEREGNTELTQNAEIRFKGFLRVLSVLFGPAFKKKTLAQARNEFARLKEICEGDKQLADSF